jgi:hypothetical protein
VSAAITSPTQATITGTPTATCPTGATGYQRGVYVSPGGNADGIVDALCRSDFAPGGGPLSSAWTARVYAPVPVPGAPGGVSVSKVITSSAGRGVSSMGWGGSSSGYATSYRGHGSVNVSGYLANSAVMSSGSPSLSTGCLGDPNRGWSSATGYIAAGNGSGWSGYSSASRSTRTGTGPACS